jgi:hypothetical protein
MTACACGAPAVVQWQRRPTPEELTRITDAERARRAAAVARGFVLDEETPAPGEDAAVPVFACAAHALAPDLAAKMHASACLGGLSGGGCDCDPEEPEFPFDTADPADG